MVYYFRCCLLLILCVSVCHLSGQPSDVEMLKGQLLYENSLATDAELEDWRLEGPAKTESRDGWMYMQSPGEEGHHVFWCPEEFPSNFVAEWELQNLHPESGLCIFFFAATGHGSRSIFDPSLAPREGVFRQYTKSDVDCYHISYYANADGNGRLISHLRKNSGFHKVQVGKEGIPLASTKIHRVTLIKEEAHIRMLIDGRMIIDWVDDGDTYGATLGGGKMGFRQMRWSQFRYRHFRVWELAHEGHWKRHTIDASSTGADGVRIADVNGDDLPDLVAGWEEGGLTKLYLHPGKDQVVDPWPAITVGETPNVEDACFVDLDRDGRPDVVSCTEGNSRRILLHRAQPRRAVGKGKWRQSLLRTSKDRMKWMYALGLQIDGRHGIDLVAAGRGAEASLGWFEAPKRAGSRKWPWHEITPVGWIMSILSEDMDHDGDLDVIITDRRGAQQACRWLENPGHGEAQKGPWPSHVIGGAGTEVMFMSMADLDGDASKEVVVAERTGQTIRIYRRQDAKGRQWQESMIELPVMVGAAKSVEVGDVNGDAVADLVVSTNTNGRAAQGLVWLDGTQIAQDIEPTFQSVSGAHNAKFDKIELLDIDQDGDLDILTCEENFGNDSRGLGVIWYENKLKP